MIVLSPTQIDALGELVNIGMGRAANMLHELTGLYIHLAIPSIQVMGCEELGEFNQQFSNRPVAAILQEFKGEYSGRAGLVIPEESALKLVAAITGEQALTQELEVLQGETLSEVGNIVINALIGTISNILNVRRMQFELAEYYKDEVSNALRPLHSAGEFILIARLNFTIQELEISGHLLLTFDDATADSLLLLIDNIS